MKNLVLIVVIGFVFIIGLVAVGKFAFAQNACPPTGCVGVGGGDYHIAPGQENITPPVGVLVVPPGKDTNFSTGASEAGGCEGTSHCKNLIFF